MAPAARPAPLGYQLIERWVEYELPTPLVQPPRGFAKDLQPALYALREDLRKPLRDCAFGNEPWLDRAVWVVLRVAAGGAVTIAEADSSGLQPAASCARRVIGASPFPDVGREYAVSIVLVPSAPSPPEVVEAPWGREDLRLDPAAPPPAHASSIAIENLQVKGRLPPEVVRRLLVGRVDVFRTCHEERLRVNPSLAAKLDVEFEVGSDGAVRRPAVRSSFRDAALVSCITKRLETIPFPQPEGGVATVSSVFTLISNGQPLVRELPTLGGSPFADVTLADVARRLEQRSFEVAVPPGRTPANTPALFVRHRASSDVVVVTLGGMAPLSDETCSLGTTTHSVVVRGPGCERVVSALSENP
jgi:hypothetical protein